jgi:hypothetical protein
MHTRYLNLLRAAKLQLRGRNRILYFPDIFVKYINLSISNKVHKAMRNYKGKNIQNVNPKYAVTDFKVNQDNGIVSATVSFPKTSYNRLEIDLNNNTNEGRNKSDE